MLGMETAADLLHNNECLNAAMLHAAMWIFGGLFLVMAIQWYRIKPSLRLLPYWVIGLRLPKPGRLEFLLIGASLALAFGDFFLTHELCRSV